MEVLGQAQGLPSDIEPDSFGSSIPPTAASLPTSCNLNDFHSF